MSTFTATPVAPSDTYATERRIAFEHHAKFRLFRLRRDAAGRYVSRRTQRAWNEWLVAHFDVRVAEAGLRAEWRVEQLDHTHSSVDLASLVVAINAAWPLDTIAHTAKRIELAERLAFWAASAKPDPCVTAVRIPAAMPAAA